MGCQMGLAYEIIIIILKNFKNFWGRILEEAQGFGAPEPSKVWELKQG
jgi:hypothetical protein